MTHTDSITVRASHKSIGGFVPLLGQGVGLDAPVGVSVHELLSVHLAFGADYVSERIQTIFVNGRAVDRERETMVADGDVIALSAAMPGLVGATLRKGGFFSRMRSDISQDRSDITGAAGRGRITLKLFNLIAPEMGPRILSQGIWITGEQMRDTLKMLSAFGPAEDEALMLNGAPVDTVQLMDRRQLMEVLFLQVDFEKA